MRAFVPKKKVPQQATSANSAVLRQANIRQSHDDNTTTVSTARFGHDFSRIPVHSAQPTALSPVTSQTPAPVPASAFDGASTTAFAVGSQPFSATIRKVDNERTTPSPPATGRASLVAMQDSPLGEEIEPAIDPTSVVPQMGPAPEEPAPGETVTIPDITLPGMEAMEMTDAVAGELAYKGSFSQGGEPPRNRHRRHDATGFAGRLMEAIGERRPVLSKL